MASSSRDDAVALSTLQARAPLQIRTQQRVAKVLAAAEALLGRLGPEETSIPEIAKISGVPRSSIYQFFPNKYVLFAHLAEQHLLVVANAIATMGATAHDQRWQDLVPVLINTAADYYNVTPVASILVLGGPFSRLAYQAQEISLTNIGSELRTVFASLDSPLMIPNEPDIATLAVEIVFACMKHGYYRENHISAAVQAEASRVVISYMKNWD